MVFRFTFSFLFPSTSQCPLYFLFDTNFYLTKYLYRRLEVKIYANVECVNKLFKAGGEFCLHSFLARVQKTANTIATPIKNDFKFIVCRWQ